MGSTIAAIELLSDRIDIAVVKGAQVVSSRRIPIQLPSEPTSWAKLVLDLGEKLRPVVEEMGISGAPTRLVFRSPTQSVDLASFEFRSPIQAAAAAKLPCLESLAFNANSAVCEAIPVGRDSEGANRKWHVVVAADRIDVVRALVEFVERSGLLFESATPIDAAIMARLVRRALEHNGPQHGWLHFGKHSSFFIVGGEGRVRFERSIALGLETIVQSLTRPIRMPDEDPIELDIESANKIVYEHGIPDADDVVLEEPRLTRRHIMPQIQPVLQRYVVELRQSLRFGLPENERDSIAVTVCGPGAAIPGLAELLAGELKLQFTSDPKYDNFDYRNAAGPGSELLDALESQPFLKGLNIQPKETASRRQLKRMRNWLWSGAAAAVFLVGLDGFRLHSKLRDVRDEAESRQNAAVELEVLEKTHQKLLGAVEAMIGVETAIISEVGAQANLRAILQELSRVTPESVRLSSIRLGREDNVMVGWLHGRAAQVDKDGSTELEPFIEALKASPLVASAVLRNVELGGVGDSLGQRFEATFRAVRAPNAATLSQVVSAPDGADR